MIRRITWSAVIVLCAAFWAGVGYIVKEALF